MPSFSPLVSSVNIDQHLQYALQQYMQHLHWNWQALHAWLCGIQHGLLYSKPTRRLLKKVMEVNHVMSFRATMVSIQRDMVKAANFKMAKRQFFSLQYAFYVEVDVFIKNSHAKVIQLMFLPFISFRSTIVTERHFAHLSEVLSTHSPCLL